jgi:ubiquinone/menaquinone biosynthesis C-methylase UbiE
MLKQFRARSDELEHLDKGDYTPAEYEGCLIELRRVNRWLGDTWAFQRTMLAEIERAGLPEFSALDVGAGSGELLRAAARWAREKRKRARLFGLEYNARSARAICEESPEFSEITALQGDAFALPFADDSFDYAFSSLFTHHFRDDQLVKILPEMARVARRGVFVIDLHRHPVAYAFYTTIGRLFLRNRLIREDGALSILRSFKPDELLELAKTAGQTNATIERKFPYRLVLRINRP